MKANERNLLTLLDGTKQFILPIYQRRYSWKKVQCEELWEDVVRIGETEGLPYHFFGSIVSREEGTPAKPQFFVIDGQQRLTTFSLLLSALGRAIEASDTEIGTDRGEIEDYYLFNSREKGEFRHKLLLTKPDRDTLIQLLEGGTSFDYSSSLVKNYNFFKKQLKSDNLETVYKGIQKLMIVDIVIGPNADNPQLIFESLNSKGVVLSQTDLIRNYVLMGQKRDFQSILYDDYWYPMERSFGIKLLDRFDLFIRDYLTLKTGKLAGSRTLYKHFKRYMPDAGQPQEVMEIVDDITHYSTHYNRVALRCEYDTDFRACIEDLDALDVDVAYPILLGVYEGYARGKIEKMEVIEIFRLIESYVFRRMICNLRRSSMNTNFASIANWMDTLLKSPPSQTNYKPPYLAVLKHGFSMWNSSIDRFPSDDEFKRDFLTSKVYKVGTCRYLLGKLENDGREEPISVTNYTVEHVMPYELTEEWESELGDDWSDTYDRFLNTVGNLTLTEHNSELSNRSFKEKQDHKPGGYRDSQLHLNQSLTQVEQWNAAAIVKRAKMFSKKACKIWTYIDLKTTYE